MISPEQDPHGRQRVVQRGQRLDSANGVVIVLHGRGASAADILSLADEFALPELAYLAPDAAGNTWYPHSFLSPIEENQPWLDSALGLVGSIVKRTLAAGVPQNRIAIMGFSQGACLASEFVARNPAAYGGLIAFTGGLIGPRGNKFSYPGSLAGVPAFLGSSDPDAHVPWERVAETGSVLSSLGATVSLRRYPGMGHTINEDEITAARSILAPLAALNGT